MEKFEPNERKYLFLKNAYVTTVRNPDTNKLHSFRIKGNKDIEKADKLMGEIVGQDEKNGTLTVRFPFERWWGKKDKLGDIAEFVIPRNEITFVSDLIP